MPIIRFSEWIEIPWPPWPDAAVTEGSEEVHKWTWGMLVVIKVRPVPLSQLLAGLYLIMRFSCNMMRRPLTVYCTYYPLSLSLLSALARRGLFPFPACRCGRQQCPPYITSKAGHIFPLTADNARATLSLSQIISRYHPIHTISDWPGDEKPSPTKTWTRRKIPSTPESSLWREASPTVGWLSLAAGGRQECGDKGQFSVRNANLRPTHFDSSSLLFSLRYLRGRKEEAGESEGRASEEAVCRSVAWNRKRTWNGGTK